MIKVPYTSNAVKTNSIRLVVREVTGFVIVKLSPATAGANISHVKLILLRTSDCLDYCDYCIVEPLISNQPGTGL